MEKKRRFDILPSVARIDEAAGDGKVVARLWRVLRMVAYSFMQQKMAN